MHDFGGGGDECVVVVGAGEGGGGETWIVVVGGGDECVVVAGAKGGIVEPAALECAVLEVVVRAADRFCWE